MQVRSEKETEEDRAVIQVQPGGGGSHLKRPRVPQASRLSPEPKGVRSPFL